MTNAFSDMTRATIRVRDFGRCVRCNMAGDEMHHRRSKSVQDHHTNAACNGIPLCGWGNHTGCHGWVHSNPFEARSQGYIVSRHSNPEEVPVFTQQHGWVLLTHDGDFEETGDPNAIET